MLGAASWLLHDKQHSYQGLEDAMVRFAGKYRCPMGGYGGFFHRWLFAPESRWPDCGTPYQSATGRCPYGSWGNGSAMRASAVGWFFDTLEETERVAEISAAITHNAPEGIKGAQAQWDSSCQGTVPQAIIAFLDSESFEDAIRKAVSLGGDSDTLACITGGIAEAYYGLVPATLADPALERLPDEFKDLLYAFSEASAYPCRIALID